MYSLSYSSLRSDKLLSESLGFFFFFTFMGAFIDGFVIFAYFRLSSLMKLLSRDKEELPPLSSLSLGSLFYLLSLLGSDI